MKMIKPITPPEITNEQEFLVIAKFFVAKLPAYLSDISSLRQTNNWPELKDLFHTLKGSAGGVGYPTVSKLAKDLESYTSTQDIESLDKGIAELKDMSEQIIAGISN